MSQDEIKNEQTLCFPFEFVPMNGQKCSFLQNVEAILNTDLQSRDSFGCMIQSCHTHAGSKIHFQSFVEAEILFHNNYYNNGFAYLTVSEILKRIEADGHTYKHIYLIGYERFSELFLREVRRLLVGTAKNQDGSQIVCDYFIYETVSASDNSGKQTEPYIRNLYKGEMRNICCYGLPSKAGGTTLLFSQNLQENLFVYIVPINTTLSTMDKMISLFEQSCGIMQDSVQSDLLRKMYICLITIGPHSDNHCENIYWEMPEISNNNRGNQLKPKDGKFLNLTSEDNVQSFAYIKSAWTYAKKLPQIKDICESCYPDKSFPFRKLIDETPIFDVTRSSVVPMLQLGQLSQLEPIPKPIETVTNNSSTMCGLTKFLVNLKRVWALSEYTSYHHITRGNNHFQFYVDAPGFISAYGSPFSIDKDLSIAQYLLSIRSKNTMRSKSKVIYNYIVAPCHSTNAAWVNMVYSNVFTNDTVDFNEEFNGARVLYFDIAKEYRSNFKAKYSDFFQSFANIIRRDWDYEIRFHYVDETIASGSRFLRAADLVQSLLTSVLREENEKEKILERVKLFYSVYLLYGRSSYDSKMFYYRLFKEACVNDIETLMRNHFHEYVNLRISQMRNYKDACVLCKMTGDYRLIQQYCATNKMAKACCDIIEAHKPAKARALAERSKFCCNIEKRYLFLLSHLLNSRLCTGNMPLFPKEKKENQRQIDVEAKEAAKDIKIILIDYFDNGKNWLEEIIGSTGNNDLDAYQTAFIKSISRPFFTFHLRKRQASFSFCLDLLEKKLKTANKDTTLVHTLVKALADMNANYLIRQKPFLRFIKLAELDEAFPAIYCGAVKKMMSLSQDTTKSLLLEHILINQSEDGFFGEANPLNAGKGINKFIEKRQHLSLLGVLYIENNRIIVDALNDIYSRPDLTDNRRTAYFLDNFHSLLNINGSSLDDSFGSDYKKLIDGIREKKELSFSALQSLMKSIHPNSELKTVEHDDFWVMPFVRIKSISDNKQNFNKLFEFIHFMPNDNSGNLKRFYHDKNFSVLRNMFRNVFDAFEVKSPPVNNDVVFGSDGSICIRFLPFNQITSKGGSNKDHQETANSINEKPGVVQQEDTDVALYLQIQGFDSKKLVHWFRLKMLMALHGEIANMIEAINMPVLIERRLNEMIQAAISEKSSLMHSDIESAMNMKFWPNHPEIFGIGKVLGAIQSLNSGTVSDGAKDLIITTSRLFCQYYSRLADELLASWYRKLIRREKNFESSQLTQQNLLPDLRNLCQQPFFKTADTNDTVEDFFMSLFNARFDKRVSMQNTPLHCVGEFIYYIHKAEASFFEITVKIWVNNNKDGNRSNTNFEVLSLATDGSRISRSTLYPIIALLIQNAAAHSSAKEIDVIFDVPQKSIRVENLVKQNIGSSTSEITKRLDEFVSVLPFIRNNHGQEIDEKNGGITLWTLKHLTKKHDWIKAEIDRKSQKFVVTICNCIEPYYEPDTGVSI